MFLFGLEETLNRPGILYYNERTALYIESFYNDFDPDNREEKVSSLDRRGVRRNVFNVAAKVSVTNQRVDGEGGTLEPSAEGTPNPSPSDTTSPTTSVDDSQSPTVENETSNPTVTDGSDETSSPTIESSTLFPTSADSSSEPTFPTSATSSATDTYQPTIENSTIVPTSAVASSEPSFSTLNTPSTSSSPLSRTLSFTPSVVLSTTPSADNVKRRKRTARKHGSTHKVVLYEHVLGRSRSYHKLIERHHYPAAHSQRALQFSASDCSGEFLAVQLTIELSYQLKGENIDLDDIIAEPFRREEYRAIYIDDFLKNADFGNVGPFADLTCTSPILFPGYLETDLPTYSPTTPITDSPTTFAPTEITGVPTLSPSLVSQLSRTSSSFVF